MRFVNLVIFVLIKDSFTDGISPNVSSPLAASPRDDLESLVYSLICLLTGELDYIDKLCECQCIKGEN
ncbi:hypothetical protein BKA69DRAFT_1090965, partial [Paraphysoderma sedebokerense]